MDRTIVKTRISRQLTGKIASRLEQLAQGQSKPIRLPSERELCKKFQISRRGVRLAIQLLENRNLIVRKHGSGNYLLPKRFSLTSAYLIIPDQLKPDDPFYSSLIGQLTLYAQRHQIQLLPVRLGNDVLLNKDLPGIILAKISQKQFQQVISTLQTVVAMTDLNTDLCCQIVFDDYGIGQTAARKLAEFGHERILFLAGPRDEFISARQRADGFLNEASLLNLNVELHEGKMNWRSGYQLLKQYLATNNSGHLASAIFASNDWMAAGALQALAESGLNVPDDFSLIGCDDVPLAAQLQPPLATFELDTAQFVEQTFLALEQAWRLQLPKKIILSAAFIHRPSLANYATKTPSHEEQI